MMSYPDQFLVLAGTAGIGFATVGLIVAPFFFSALAEKAKSRVVNRFLRLRETVLVLAFFDILILACIGSFLTTGLSLAALVPNALHSVINSFAYSTRWLFTGTLAMGSIAVASFALLDPPNMWPAIVARTFVALMNVLLLHLVATIRIDRQDDVILLIFTLVFTGFLALTYSGITIASLRLADLFQRKPESKGRKLRRLVSAYVTGAICAFVFTLVEFSAVAKYDRGDAPALFTLTACAIVWTVGIIATALFCRAVCRCSLRLTIVELISRRHFLLAYALSPRLTVSIVALIQKASANVEEA